jgi:hypothetical protein
MEAANMTDMEQVKGYLVVLIKPEPAYPHNPFYRGIDRVPGQQTGGRFPGLDAAAMEKYVFDARFNDENGLIPNREAAVELLRMFPRPGLFEIIYVQTTDCETKVSTISTHHDFALLGYDVATRAPAESIVADWPPHLSKDTYQLNENGLLQNCEDASRFLERCVASAQEVEEYGSELYVWEVYRLEWA